MSVCDISTSTTADSKKSVLKQNTINETSINLTNLFDKIKISSDNETQTVNISIESIASNCLSILYEK